MSTTCGNGPTSARWLSFHSAGQQATLRRPDAFTALDVGMAGGGGGGGGSSSS